MTPNQQRSPSTVERGGSCLPPMAMVKDALTLPGELSAKFQTRFYPDRKVAQATRWPVAAAVLWQNWPDTRDVIRDYLPDELKVQFQKLT